MKPHQIISLMDFAGRRQHARRWPTTTTTSTSASTPPVRHHPKLAKQLSAILKPSQWDRLIERLGKIDNPTVPLEPSKGALKVERRRGKTAERLTEDRRFRFVQWEFAGRLGPPPGRYVVRRFAGDDVREVVVVTERRPRRAAARRAANRRIVAGDPRHGDRRRLARRRRRRAAVAARADTPDASRPSRRFLAAHRVAAADPFAPDADPARALVIRVGLRHRRPGRRGRMDRRARRCRRPRAADAAGAAPSTAQPTGSPRCCPRRDAVLACEELTLRARADLDRGRDREAALQLEAALRRGAWRSSVAWREHRGPRGGGWTSSRGTARGVRAAASAAREGTLEPARSGGGHGGLARLEAALRALGRCTPRTAPANCGRLGRRVETSVGLGRRG